ARSQEAWAWRRSWKRTGKLMSDRPGVAGFARCAYCIVQLQLRRSECLARPDDPTEVHRVAGWDLRWGEGVESGPDAQGLSHARYQLPQGAAPRVGPASSVLPPDTQLGHATDSILADSQHSGTRTDRNSCARLIRRERRQDMKIAVIGGTGLVGSQV